MCHKLLTLSFIAILLCVGCYSRRPSQGIILIDTDLPTTEAMPLEIGFSLEADGSKKEGTRNLRTGLLYTAESTQRRDSLQSRSLDAAKRTDSLHFPQVHQMSESLLEQLRELHPSFIRYPVAREGARYPIPSKSEWQHLQPTQEKTKQKNFGPKELLAIADLLKSEPILVTTLGYEQKLETFVHFLRELKAPQLILQPEYNADGISYFYRFTALEEELERDSINYQLISSGRLTPHRRYSDFVYDWAAPPFTAENILQLDTLLTEYNPLIESMMISEVTFDDHTESGRFIPPLALRAAFLIIAEAHSSALRSIGITPLVGESLQKDFPLLLLDEDGFHRTQWYSLLQLFRQEKGSEQVRLSDALRKQQDLLVHITKDKQDVYYLKAVNMTRHPLQYQIQTKGDGAIIHYVECISYTPKAKSTTSNLTDFLSYSISSFEQPLNARTFEYYFQPFEVTLIKLTL